jgi:hypothetical protein
MSTKALDEGDAVTEHALLELLNGGVVESAVGVVVALVEVRRHRGDEHRAVNALVSVVAEVARHLAAAHREADQGGVAKVEGAQQLVQISGQGVVVIPVPGPRRAPESAAVVGDDAVSGVDQRGHLRFPGAPTERPAVDQDHRATGPVVFEVDLLLVRGGELGHVWSAFRSLAQRT